MKKYLSRIICVLLVIALAIGGLWYVNGVLIMKRSDGILTMQDFYAQPDGTVDVLLVGNSHSGINIDTATLWDSRGIAAYDLWGGVQPLWNSYHYIVEALKYQTPKLIVLEVMASTSDYEYSEEQNQIKNTAGMRLSKNKLEAVRASAPEDRQLNLLLGFPLYHGRFDELTMEDFQHFPWSNGLENFKGSVLRYGTGSYEFESAEGISDTAPVMDKELEYLNRIIGLCREKNVPLMLLKTPSLEREQTQPILNTVAGIAEDNGLAFVNMNLMDDELGITADDWSLDRHMNASGARKVSAWLADYLQSEYDIPDRRYGLYAYDSKLMRSCLTAGQTCLFTDSGDMLFTYENQFKTEADVSKFLKQLHAQVLEKMLEGEMDDHLGYEKNSIAGNNTGNSRNGSYPKKIHTGHGESVISIPRDRNGQFEPIAVPKHESRGFL